MKTVLIAVNTAKYFLTHRQDLAKEISSQDYKVIVLIPHGQPDQEIKDLGFEVKKVFLTRRGKNPFIELFSLLHYFILILRYRPVAFLGFTIKCNIYGGFAARLLRVKNILLTISGLGYVFTENKENNTLLRKLVLSLYHISFNSRKIKVIVQNKIDEAFFLDNKIIKKENCVLIPGTGVNLSKISPQFSTETNTPQILFPARLLKDKGLMELIEACKQLYQENQSFKLVICGYYDPGNPSCVDKKELESWNNISYINYQGFQKNMAPFFSQADIICLPSYREGLPLSLIEGGSYGKPSVTTDTVGCKDVIKQNYNGLLVPIQNISALKEALQKLLSNKDFREELGRNSRRHVEENYNQDVLLKRYISLIS